MSSLEGETKEVQGSSCSPTVQSNVTTSAISGQIKFIKPKGLRKLGSPFSKTIALSPKIINNKALNERNCKSSSTDSLDDQIVNSFFTSGRDEKKLPYTKLTKPSKGIKQLFKPSRMRELDVVEHESTKEPLSKNFKSDKFKFSHIKSDKITKNEDYLRNKRLLDSDNDFNAESINSSVKFNEQVKKKHKGPSLSKLVGFKIKLAPNPNTNQFSSQNLEKMIVKIDTGPVIDKKEAPKNSIVPLIEENEAPRDFTIELTEKLVSEAPQITLKRKYLKNNPNNREELDLALSVIPRRRPDKSLTNIPGGLFDLNQRMASKIYFGSSLDGDACVSCHQTSISGVDHKQFKPNNKSNTLPAGFVSSWANFEDGVTLANNQNHFEQNVNLCDDGDHLQIGDNKHEKLKYWMSFEEPVISCKTKSETKLSEDDDKLHTGNTEIKGMYKMPKESVEIIEDEKIETLSNLEFDPIYDNVWFGNETSCHEETIESFHDYDDIENFGQFKIYASATPFGVDFTHVDDSNDTHGIDISKGPLCSMVKIEVSRLDDNFISSTPVLPENSNFPCDHSAISFHLLPIDNLDTPVSGDDEKTQEILLRQFDYVPLTEVETPLIVEGPAEERMSRPMRFDRLFQLIPQCEEIEFASLCVHLQHKQVCTSEINVNLENYENMALFNSSEYFSLNCIEKNYLKVARLLNNILLVHCFAEQCYLLDDFFSIDEQVSYLDEFHDNACQCIIVLDVEYHCSSNLVVVPWETYNCFSVDEFDLVRGISCLAAPINMLIYTVGSVKILFDQHQLQSNVAAIENETGQQSEANNLNSALISTEDSSVTDLLPNPTSSLTEENQMEHSFDICLSTTCDDFISHTFNNFPSFDSEIYNSSSSDVFMCDSQFKRPTGLSENIIKNSENRFGKNNVQQTAGGEFSCSHVDSPPNNSLPIKINLSMNRDVCQNIRFDKEISSENEFDNSCKDNNANMQILDSMCEAVSTSGAILIVGGHENFSAFMNEKSMIPVEYQFVPSEIMPDSKVKISDLDPMKMSKLEPNMTDSHPSSEDNNYSSNGEVDSSVTESEFTDKIIGKKFKGIPHFSSDMTNFSLKSSIVNSIFPSSESKPVICVQNYTDKQYGLSKSFEISTGTDFSPNNSTFSSFNDEVCLKSTPLLRDILQSPCMIAHDSLTKSENVINIPQLVKACNTEIVSLPNQLESLRAKEMINELICAPEFLISSKCIPDNSILDRNIDNFAELKEVNVHPSYIKSWPIVNFPIKKISEDSENDFTGKMNDDKVPLLFFNASDTFAFPVSLGPLLLNDSEKIANSPPHGVINFACVNSEPSCYEHLEKIVDPFINHTESCVDNFMVESFDPMIPLSGMVREDNNAKFIWRTTKEHHRLDSLDEINESLIEERDPDNEVSPPTNGKVNIVTVNVEENQMEHSFDICLSTTCDDFIKRSNTANLSDIEDIPVGSLAEEEMLRALMFAYAEESAQDFIDVFVMNKRECVLPERIQCKWKRVEITLLKACQENKIIPYEIQGNLEIENQPTTCIARESFVPHSENLTNAIKLPLVDILISKANIKKYQNTSMNDVKKRFQILDASFNNPPQFNIPKLKNMSVDSLKPPLTVHSNDKNSRKKNNFDSIPPHLMNPVKIDVTGKDDRVGHNRISKQFSKTRSSSHHRQEDTFISKNAKPMKKGINDCVIKKYSSMDDSLAFQTAEMNHEASIKLWANLLKSNRIQYGLPSMCSFTVSQETLELYQKPLFFNRKYSLNTHKSGIGYSHKPVFRREKSFASFSLHSQMTVTKPQLRRERTFSSLKATKDVNLIKLAPIKMEYCEKPPITNFQSSDYNPPEITTIFVKKTSEAYISSICRLQKMLRPGRLFEDVKEDHQKVCSTFLNSPPAAFSLQSNTLLNDVSIISNDSVTFEENDSFFLYTSQESLLSACVDKSESADEDCLEKLENISTDDNLYDDIFRNPGIICSKVCTLDISYNKPNNEFSGEVINILNPDEYDATLSADKGSKYHSSQSSNSIMNEIRATTLELYRAIFRRQNDLNTHKTIKLQEPVEELCTDQELSISKSNRTHDVSSHCLGSSIQKNVLTSKANKLKMKFNQSIKHVHSGTEKNPKLDDVKNSAFQKKTAALDADVKSKFSRDYGTNETASKGKISKIDRDVKIPCVPVRRNSAKEEMSTNTEIKDHKGSNPNSNTCLKTEPSKVKTSNSLSPISLLKNKTIIASKEIIGSSKKKSKVTTAEHKQSVQTGTVTDNALKKNSNNFFYKKIKNDAQQALNKKQKEVAAHSINKVSAKKLNDLPETKQSDINVSTESPSEKLLVSNPQLVIVPLPEECYSSTRDIQISDCGPIDPQIIAVSNSAQQLHPSNVEVVTTGVSDVQSISYSATKDNFMLDTSLPDKNLLASNDFISDVSSSDKNLAACNDFMPDATSPDKNIVVPSLNFGLINPSVCEVVNDSHKENQFNCKSPGSLNVAEINPILIKNLSEDVPQKNENILLIHSAVTSNLFDAQTNLAQISNCSMNCAKESHSVDNLPANELIGTEDIFNDRPDTDHSMSQPISITKEENVNEIVLNQFRNCKVLNQSLQISQLKGDSQALALDQNSYLNDNIQLDLKLDHHQFQNESISCEDQNCFASAMASQEINLTQPAEQLLDDQLLQNSQDNLCEKETDNSQNCKQQSLWSRGSSSQWSSIDLESYEFYENYKPCHLDEAMMVCSDEDDAHEEALAWTLADIAELDLANESDLDISAIHWLFSKVTVTALQCVMHGKCAVFTV